jgi:hypothetical protein
MEDGRRTEGISGARSAQPANGYWGSSERPRDFITNENFASEKGFCICRKVWMASVNTFPCFALRLLRIVIICVSVKSPLLARVRAS